MFGRERLGTRLAGGWPAGAAVESVSVKVTPGSAGGPANVVGTGVGTIKISVSGEHGVVYLQGRLPHRPIDLGRGRLREPRRTRPRTPMGIAGMGSR